MCLSFKFAPVAGFEPALVGVAKPTLIHLATFVMGYLYPIVHTGKPLLKERVILG